MTEHDEWRSPALTALDKLSGCYKAVAQLSTVQLRTLHSYATFRMIAIRGIVSSTDPADLLQEAITRTLNGSRNWDSQKIDFVTHLKGCMRSIASELAKRARLELEAAKDSASNQQAIEVEYYAPLQILDDLRIELRQDETALRILELLLQGNTRGEIVRALQMRTDVYDAARKRITRALYAVARRRK